MEKRKGSLLSKGRPPHAHKPASSMNSKSNRHVINKTHQINKALAVAKAKNDISLITNLENQLTALGGLESYQTASMQGQSAERGGDSSIILLDFLQPLKPTLANLDMNRARLLEIGALSAKNACARSGLFEMTRIDLHSQSAEITEQDFMLRPLPRFKEEKFDLISLSLVLNFVPSPEERGEMLRRTSKFLDRRLSLWLAERMTEGKKLKEDGRKLLEGVLPALFLVLPAPCVTNSRYCDEERLTLIMASLGFVLLNVKLTDRMYYSLWQLRDPFVPEEQNFPKVQVHPGAGRNNFSIVLRP